MRYLYGLGAVGAVAAFVSLTWLLAISLGQRTMLYVFGAWTFFWIFRAGTWAYDVKHGAVK